MALPAQPARTGRLSGRRHEARQNDPDPRAAPDPEAQAARSASEHPHRTSLLAGQLGLRSQTLCARPSRTGRPPLRYARRDSLRGLDEAGLSQTDLVITSFGTLLRQPALETIRWRLAIGDEAQAIKNPGARQTRQIKKLQAQARIALTGTPWKIAWRTCGPSSISLTRACWARRRILPDSAGDWRKPVTSVRFARSCDRTFCAA
ncbi:Helicase, SNF2/RAD54 family [Candidatus Burkholderia humilis]|nr:Helicase, SNF2/RAD54 family [Candidatus Burkholderia humilis]